MPARPAELAAAFAAPRNATVDAAYVQYLDEVRTWLEVEQEAALARLVAREDAVANPTAIARRDVAATLRELRRGADDAHGAGAAVTTAEFKALLEKAVTWKGLTLKAAFNGLAKLYHPDVPQEGGVDVFEQYRNLQSAFALANAGFTRAPGAHATAKDARAAANAAWAKAEAERHTRAASARRHQATAAAAATAPRAVPTASAGEQQQQQRRKQERQRRTGFQDVMGASSSRTPVYEAAQTAAVKAYWQEKTMRQGAARAVAHRTGGGATRGRVTM